MLEYRHPTRLEREGMLFHMSRSPKGCEEIMQTYVRLKGIAAISSPSSFMGSQQEILGRMIQEILEAEYPPDPPVVGSGSESPDA